MAISRRLSLPSFLHASGDFALDQKGDATNPTGLIFPRRIVPWDDFAARQEEIWNELSASGVFHSQPWFPSKPQMDHTRSRIRPISNELSLQNFERVAVEDAVEILFEHARNDSQLQNSFNLQGPVSFKNHTNLEDGVLETPMSLKRRRKSRGKGSRTDEFLVCKTSDSAQTPVAAIEYKPPRKLSVNELVTGLSSEIWPERDVINKGGDDFASTSRLLATAVVTQLFSYMIGKGLQYGYVCTGQAFVFLHIPDDPSIIYFSLCVPSMDVMDGDDTRLHRTAVAQVFAFLLQAIRAEPPPEAWHDEAEKLGLWEVEYDDILAEIPTADRKRKESPTFLYRPQRWKDFNRSLLDTRLLVDGHPLLLLSTSGKKDGQDGKTQVTEPHIKSRPFCTQQCLLGLALGKPIDKSCPNAGCHGQKHISRFEFLHLIREQLAVDRGRDADCMPLYRSGSRSSLFKLRLSSHGYTLVAKGIESLDLAHLQHENEIYDCMLAIQGSYIPVCLGNINLILPYYYDCGVYKHFMFLAWAGRPVFQCTNQISHLDMVSTITSVFKAIHKLRVLHRDAELRNILYDEHSGTFMVVDFKRAAYCGGGDENREVEMMRNPKRRKREISEDDFVSELEWALYEVLRHVSSLNKAS
ncbi:hypothetical protein TrVFT333_001532 [Trichoderma virens FT-333]|nr:hypothetical protein TrVFT333_001532 [Trichoderma virens FT-333]